MSLHEDVRGDSHVNLTTEISGISLDAIRPLEQLPTYEIHTIGEQEKYPARKSEESPKSTIRIGTPDIDRLGTSISCLPTGRSVVEVLPTENGLVYEVAMIPEVLDSTSSERMLFFINSQAEDERRDAINYLFSFSQLIVNPRDGVMLDLADGPVFQMFPNGEIVFDDDYSQSHGTEWEGLGTFKMFGGKTPSFECAVARIEAGIPVNDRLSNGEIVTHSVTEEHFLITGAMFGALDAVYIHEEIKNMIEQGTVSDDQLRNLIYPYMYLVPCEGKGEGGLEEEFVEFYEDDGDGDYEDDSYPFDLA